MRTLPGLVHLKYTHNHIKICNNKRKKTLEHRLINIRNKKKTTSNASISLPLLEMIGTLETTQN